MKDVNSIYERGKSFYLLSLLFSVYGAGCFGFFGPFLADKALNFTLEVIIFNMNIISIQSKIYSLSHIDLCDEFRWTSAFV